MKALCLLALLGASFSTIAAPQTVPQAASPALGSALRNAIPGPSAKDCRSDDPTAVIVCGRSQHPYRIDSDVLAAERSTEAPAIRPPLTADDVQTACMGPNCGNGGVIPVVGMVLVAVAAVAMAADGDDWRQLFRTHEEEYQAYLDAKSKEAKERRVQILGGLIRK